MSGLLNLNLECGKNSPAPPDYKYTFLQKVMVKPYQLSYNVGDTIQLQLYAPRKKLFDAKTNTETFFDSAGFNFAIAVNLIFNNPYVGDGPFASYIFNPGVSAYTTTYTGTTQAYINSGCTQANDYKITVGVVLIKKGVFSIGVYGNDFKNCTTGNSSNAQLMLTLDVDDTHKSYYQQLPFPDIGKSEDSDVLTQLDAKWAAIINVQ